ncbi:MAG: hypothetical protein ACOWWH_09725 [Eubacteriaceae bacterium]
MFAYCNNNPVTLSDPSGKFAILATVAICAVLGAAISATTTAVMQYATTGSVNVKDVAVSAVVGAAAGALTPFVGASMWGMVGLGAASSVAQTVITNKVNGRGTSAGEIVSSAAIGAVSGGIAGKFTNLAGGYKPPTHWSGSGLPLIPIDKTIVKIQGQEILNKAVKNAILRSISTRSIISNVFSNGVGSAIWDGSVNRIKVFFGIPVQTPTSDFDYAV